MFGYTGLDRAKILTIFLGLLATGLVGCAIFFGPDLYRAWSQRNVKSRAIALVAKRDWQNAAVALRQAMAAAPDDPELIRCLIQMLDSANNGDELRWRTRLAEIDGGDPQNLMEIARLALAQRRPDAGTAALAQLARLPGHAEPDAATHNLASALATQRRDEKAAIHHASEAARLDPNSNGLKFNLASLCSRSGDPQVRARGWGILKELEQSPLTRPRARQELVNIAIAAKDWPQARAISDVLLASGLATFRDRLSHLEILNATGDPGEPAFTLELQKEAVARLPDFLALAEWMTRHRRLDQMIAWLEAQVIGSTSPRPEHERALASAYLLGGAWQKVIDRYAEMRWDERDHLRQLALARARRAIEPLSDLSWRAPWSEALQGSLRDERDAMQVISMVGRWKGWETEHAELLWRVEGAHPKRSAWALQELAALYREADDTRGLLRVAETIMRRMPDSADARNNWAYYALLLETDLPRACGLAETLHESDPTNPIYASTHALGLSRQGRYREAEAILARLPDQDRNHPAIAALHALALAELGQTARASERLAQAENGTLLRQEADLAARARARIKQPSARSGGS